MQRLPKLEILELDDCRGLDLHLLLSKCLFTLKELKMERVVNVLTYLESDRMKCLVDLSINKETDWSICNKICALPNLFLSCASKLQVWV